MAALLTQGVPLGACRAERLTSACARTHALASPGPASAPAMNLQQRTHTGFTLRQPRGGKETFVKSAHNGRHSQRTGGIRMASVAAQQIPEPRAARSGEPQFGTIDEALVAMAAGKFVVVLDDEDRENEGDLIMPADKMTPEAMGFMVKHTSGLVCVAIEQKRCQELNLPQMVASQENEDRMMTAYTISCDHMSTSTGISAADRSATVRALADPSTQPNELRRPGHVFPLRAREGGVLKRGGHTEAAVDMARMAGCAPVGVICEIVNEDGSCSRTPELLKFAAEHKLVVVTIADLITYRTRNERLVDRTAVARLPTQHGTFAMYSYKSVLDGIEHVAMVKGEIGDGNDLLVRVHSECLTGDIFMSSRCDCGEQLELAMKEVAAEGRGVIVYLRGQEGRGIGLTHKLRAYNLQDEGRDTVQANEDLGLPIDSREYGIGAQILQDLGVSTMRLMTNNPSKYQGLKGYGLEVVGRVPLMTPINPENRKYIETKRTKMGHLYPSDFGATEQKNGSEGEAVNGNIN